MAEDAPKPKHGKLRRGFRWFRISVLACMLLAVISLLWLNQVGLPEFAKRPILSQLRGRGIELQFERIRLRWYRGIVAENVTIGKAATEESPQLKAAEVTVRVNGPALGRGRFQVEGLVLRDGVVVVPLLASNAPPYRLQVTNIQSEVSLLQGDQWELTDLKGEALGCKFAASGTLTNASHLPELLRERAAGTGGKPRTASPRSFQTLRSVFQEIEAARFATAPEISLQLHANASNTNDYRLDLKLKAADARTRWGNVRNLLLDIPITPVTGSNGLAQTDVTLQFSRLTSELANTGPTKLDIHALQSFTNAVPVEVRVRLASRLVRSAYAEADDLKVSAASRPLGSNSWHTQLQIDASRIQSKPARMKSLAGSFEVDHSLTNFSLFAAGGDVRVDGLATEWAQAARVQLKSSRTVFTNRFLPSETSLQLILETPQSQWASATNLTLSGNIAWSHATRFLNRSADLGFWAGLWPFAGTVQVATTNLHTAQIDLASSRFGLDWHAPVLKIQRLEGRLYDGSVALDASVDAFTRLVNLKGDADFDIMKIRRLFKPQTEKWLEQHEFEHPPEFGFSASAILPAWTNSTVDWESEVMPTLVVEGNVRVGKGSFRSVPYSAASTSIRLSGNTLELPELIVRRPEGVGRAKYRSDVKTRDYYWRFDSTIDPKAALPFFETESQKRVLNDFTFTTPPDLRGELWGRWGEVELTGGHVDVALTNVFYRGGGFSNVMASVEYTNLVAVATNITVQNGPQVITADGVTADIRGDRLWFTNVNSTFDPYMFTGVIGAKTREAIEPYKFHQPPTVHMTGSMPFNNEKQTDLHFNIKGGPFHYWKLNFDHISGLVHWTTNTLTITNVHARGYDGNVNWNGFFDFAPPTRTDFSFNSDYHNLDLKPLLADLNSRPSSAQGRVDGTLIITNANAMDSLSWQGYGQASMDDGYLWDIPMVGMFSGALNAIIPGLGKTRVKEGAGDFTITNSVVHTRNLELKSPAMRLQYKGTVDMEGNVNAEVEAELLRDAWVLGRIFSLAMTPITKAFVYKVTGTLNEPKSQPLYIPKLLTYPFKPLKVLKDLITDDKPKDKKPEEKKPEPTP